MVDILAVLGMEDTHSINSGIKSFEPLLKTSDSHDEVDSNRGGRRLVPKAIDVCFLNEDQSSCRGLSSPSIVKSI
jgi:hypothetical protein